MNNPDPFDPDPTALAITGMAGRFPGARTIAEFWSNLRNGVECIRPLSDGQLLAAGVDPSLLQDPNYVKASSVLDDIDLFDAAFFGLSPKDAAIMDPQHRVFLECSWEALEHAGWTPDEFPGRIGVYAGSGMNLYLIHNLLANPDLRSGAGLFLLKQTGNDKDVLATRVSYQFNLTGPSMSIQTACSTSLVAVHVACQSLLNHECDMALAGGVTIEIPHGTGYLYREGEILSRDGHCRAFDAQATGTVFGSGAGVVVLRRLADAIKDGDCIHALIRGTAINNDGSRKVGYLAPSVSGQAEVVAEALSVAGVDAESISYIETHGTGTAVGDPIEIAALTQVFGQRTARRGFCRIGSLKPSIGHLDAAAGIAGLIKTVLALRHRQLPPSLNFSQPNPAIDFQNGPFTVNDRLSEWEANGQPRRAGVTALGIGGTNAHVVLEEAPATESSSYNRSWQILTVSARTPAALERAANDLAAHLEDSDDLNLADAAYTCHFGRGAFAHRRAVLCRNAEEAARSLRDAASKTVYTGHAASKPEIAFLFPGQGSQFPNMARGLYESEPVFRGQVDSCADFLKPHLGLDLRSLLFPPAENEAAAGAQLAQTWITQPALFIIEFALAKLWMAWGIQPCAMIGHSIGEFVAACLAGVLSPEEALAAVAARGRLMQSLPNGAMLAAFASETEAQALVSGGVSLAAINGPEQCVFSGTADAIGELEQRLATKGLRFQRLHTSHAFHSDAMDPILGRFTEVMRELRLRPPEVPYISNVTGTWIKPEEAQDPVYWARHLRQTVRFSDGLRRLLEGAGALLEVGPGRVLSAFAAQLKTGRKVYSSLPGPREDAEESRVLFSTLAQLWVSGAKVNWPGFHKGERLHRVPLPTYPFERRRFWIDAPKSIPAQTAAREVKPSLSYYRPVWKRSEFEGEGLPAVDEPWLVFPDNAGLGTAMIEYLKSAGRVVITVSAGERFARTGSHAYALRPGSRADFDELVAALVRSGQVPGRIVHLWSVGAEGGSSAALEHLERIQDESFFSLLYLAQALGSHDLPDQIELGIVSNGLQQVAEEPVRHPERALLLGPAKLISKEYPKIRARSIDVVLPEDRKHKKIARQIAAELSAPAEPVVAYRGRQRWVQSLEAAPVDAKGDTTRLRPNGVYLITGGLGGIGLAIAGYLARSVQARLVLVGRSGAGAAAMEQIAALEKAGAEVLAARGDVTDLAGMGRVIAEAQARFGTIHGVIHAAGVLEDGLMQLKERESAARVLAPKVKGTLVLERLLEGAELDFFMLFSSVSSVLAPVGQVDYVAANSFLDAFAHAQRNRGPWTVAVNWARWRDVGMAAQPLPERGAHPGGHPLLRTCSVDEPGNLIFDTELSFTDHWVLHEHRLRGGDGLFPGTGYIELAHAAMSRRHGAGAIEIRRLSFNAPLRVTPGKKAPVRIRLERNGEAHAFSALLGSGEDSSTVVCTAEARHLGAIAPPTIDIEKLLRACSLGEISFGQDGRNATQAGHIDFGPRWRCLKRIHLGEDEALSVLELPREFASDLNEHRFHPALLDAATGSAMLTIPDYASTAEFYVPLSYKRITLFSPLPGRCYCHIRGRRANTVQREVATFDMTVLDETGRVIAEVEEFALRRLAGVTALPAAPSEPARRGAGAGIDTETGLAAFAAILGSSPLPQIVAAGTALPLAAPQEAPAAAQAEAAASTARLDGGAAPRDDIERTLAGWWEELLGVQQVGIRDNFFEMGGHSLTAVRLLARAEKEFQKSVSLHDLYECGTIENLADHIRGGRRGRETSIVPLSGDSRGRAFYCVHALTGEAVTFRDLARLLGPGVNLCGIQAPPGRMTAEAAPSIESVAAGYVADLRAFQPKGPYILGGWSVGSTIALEMAQQLHAAGEKVDLIVALDGAPFNTGSGTPRWSPVYHWKLLRNLPFWAKEDLMVDFSIGKLRRRILDKAQRPNKAISGFMDTRDFSERHVGYMNALYNALRRYVPKPYSGRVLLYQARTEPLHHLFEVDRAWRRIATEVQVVRVPGTHISLVEKPNVQVIAADLKPRLAAFQNEKNAAKPVSKMMRIA